MAHPRELGFVMHEADRLFTQSSYPLEEQRLKDATQRLKIYSGLLVPDAFGTIVLEGLPEARKAATPQEIGRTMLRLPRGTSQPAVRFYPEITRAIFEQILDASSEPPAITYASFQFQGRCELSLPRPDSGVQEVILRGVTDDDTERELRLQLRRHVNAPKSVPRALYFQWASGFPDQESGRAVPKRGMGFGTTSKSPGLGSSN